MPSLSDLVSLIFSRSSARAGKRIGFYVTVNFTLVRFNTILARGLRDIGRQLVWFCHVLDGPYERGLAEIRGGCVRFV